MIGLQADQVSLNSALGQNVLALRNAFQNIQNLNAYVSAQGNQAFLEGLGFTVADANAYVSTLGNHDQLREIYQGLIALANPFPYEANGNVVWGGS